MAWFLVWGSTVAGAVPRVILLSLSSRGSGGGSVKASWIEPSLGCWVYQDRNVVDLLTCWKGLLGNSEAGKVWKMIPHCIMWCLWRERNDRTFNGVEKSIPALKFYFLHTLLDWSKAYHLDFSSSLSDLVDLCSARLWCFYLLFLFHSGSLPVYLFGSFLFNEIITYKKKKRVSRIKLRHKYIPYYPQH